LRNPAYYIGKVAAAGTLRLRKGEPFVRFVRTLCAIGMALGLSGAAIDTFAQSDSQNPSGSSATFAEDVAFLRQHTSVIVLRDAGGTARLAVTPRWQGRVMTSTAHGLSGQSFGWINRKLIASRQTLAHFNPLGGEDRLWLGPEGGQFSIYFAKDAPFDLEHWYVPKALDTLPFEVIATAAHQVMLQSSFDLTNYTGTHFAVQIRRTVRLLEPATVWEKWSLHAPPGVTLVAYESQNVLTNAGSQAWRKESGLLSIWILGQFQPSPDTTIVIPIREGADTELGKPVTSDYFGAIPADRLKVTSSTVYLRADGRFRSKVGINPRRSLGTLGGYDAAHHVLTIVQSDQPAGVTDYVNSLWKIQSDPFGGDAVNAYNDGPPAPGVAPMGPFCELESSSPAAALAPHESLSHTHRTIHLSGSPDQLDLVAHAVLGVSLADIQSAFGT
jgi:hypothetical protein